MPRLSRQIVTTAAAPNDFQHAFNVVQRHWRVSAMFAVAVIALVAAATLLMRPIYEPEGRLEIDPPGTEVFSLQNTGAADANTAYLTTEAQRLQTSTLALATIRALHLDREPEIAGKLAGSPVTGVDANGATAAERRALHHFRSHLLVSEDPGSRLVAVKFASHDPQLSASVVNTLMEQFVEHNYQERHDEIVRSSTWLARQLDDIREKMEHSSKQLAEYQQEAGIADVDDNNSLADQLADLNKQLADAQAQRIQTQAYLNRVGADDALPQINASPVIQALTQKKAEVETELAQSRVIYGPTHPNVRKLQNEEKELTRQLNSQRTSIIAELKTTYAAATARERLLQGEVKTATERLNHLQQYTNLKKEAAADRQLYETLYTKVKEAGIAAASKSSNMRVVEPAPVLDHPTRPHRLFNMLVALMFSLIGAVAIPFVWEGIEARVCSAEDLRQCAGNIPVAIIPTATSADDVVFYGLPARRALTLPNGGSYGEAVEAEAVNALRTSLLLGRKCNGPKVLLVTSAVPGEGKTTIAANLAVALAQHARTCLVDADLRRPRASKALHLPPSKGLVHLFGGKATLDEVVYPVPGIANLSVLASWTATPNAAELITPATLEPIIAALRKKFDFVLIDSSPVLPFADGRVISTLVDGVVLVTRAASTPKAAVTRTIELLAEVGAAPIATVVLNGAAAGCPDYRYHYASYS
jgi:capsular exopolysaccharide synthesis family protein